MLVFSPPPLTGGGLIAIGLNAVETRPGVASRIAIFNEPQRFVQALLQDLKLPPIAAVVGMDMLHAAPVRGHHVFTRAVGVEP